MRWYQFYGRTRMQSGKLKYKKLKVMQLRVTQVQIRTFNAWTNNLSARSSGQMKFYCKMIRAKGEKTGLKERRFY